MTTSVDLPPRLSFDEPTSFAAFTLRERLPRIVDSVARLPVHSAHAARLTALRASLPAGVPPSALSATAPDQAFWNDFLQAHRGAAWRDLPFLEAEFLFYASLLDAVDYACDPARDPFAETKRKALDSARTNFPLAARQAAALTAWELAPLRAAVEWSLTGNAADLSQLGTPAASHRVLVDELDAFVREIAPGSEGVIDMMLDNAGTELIGDLVLVDCLLRALPGMKLRVHVKPLPMFVSDATRTDWRAALDQLCSDPAPEVSAWGHNLVGHERGRRLELHDDSFWCRPLSYAEMPGPLRTQLNGSVALILKGDLHYRRYVQDRAWALDGSARQHRIADLPPTLALRVMKSELGVGLPSSTVEALRSSEPDWLYNGRNSLIQYFR